MSTPLRVLIVEDEALILMQIEMLVEDKGHVIVGTAVNANEAIALAYETRPDLIFIDLRLSDGSSGLEVARAIRDLNGVTAVFMTANGRQLADDLEGATAVISKPFTESILEGSLVYLEECIRRPPPRKDIPRGMRLSPAYQASLSTTEM